MSSPVLVQRERDVVRFSKAADANRVHGSLWMGDMPIPYSRLGDCFDCLVLCAMEYQSDYFPGVEVACARLNDDGSAMTKREALEAVSAAGKVIRFLSQGKRVLVTCMAGRNRSGLVCCIALCKGAGMAPDKAVEAVRDARGIDAFRNPDFESFLRALCSPTPTGWVSSRAASSR